MCHFKIKHLDDVISYYCDNPHGVHVFDIIFTDDEGDEHTRTMKSNCKSDMNLLDAIISLKNHSGLSVDDYIRSKNNYSFLLECFGDEEEVAAFQIWARSLDFDCDTLPNGWDIEIPVFDIVEFGLHTGD